MQLLSGMEKEGTRLSKVVVDAFKMIVPTLKQYSVFCNAYQPANEMLKDKMMTVAGKCSRIDSEMLVLNG